MGAPIAKPKNDPRAPVQSSSRNKAGQVMRHRYLNLGCQIPARVIKQPIAA